MAEIKLSVPEEQAYQLSHAALLIDMARSKRGTDPEALAAALNQDLVVWVALRSIITRPDCGLGPEAKQNLVKLSHFVADIVLKGPEKLTETTLDTLININLQISEGFLEGARSIVAR